MDGIFISYRKGDTEGTAGRLFEDLVDRFGSASVFMDVEGIEPSFEFRRAIEERIAPCGVVLALIGKTWLTRADRNGRRLVDDPSDLVRLEIACALKRGIVVVPVLIHDADMPRAEQLPDVLKDLAYRHGTELTHAGWQDDVHRLITDIERIVSTQPRDSAPQARQAAQRERAPEARSSPISDIAMLPFKVVAAIAMAPVALVNQAILSVRRWNSTRSSPASQVSPVEQPLLFGLSAPSDSSPDSEFSLVFMAYVEAARESVIQQARAVGGKSHRQVLDVVPAGSAVWQKGTSFTVHVFGRSFSVEPPEQRFAWSGSQNSVGFAVRALPGTQGNAVILVLVLVAEVVIASIPLQVEIHDLSNSTSAPMQRGEARTAPHSLFASYASKDAVDVAGRLSTLLRWAPKLDIFQDCLDLRPNEIYKSQLESQISTRDAFLLFWSRNAASSSWVRWEIETALAKKPRDAILPMPLEDPALAPPPPELADLHFRDRFMLAGYAARGLGRSEVGE